MLCTFGLKFGAVNSVLVWRYALFNTMPFFLPQENDLNVLVPLIISILFYTPSDDNSRLKS